MEQPWRDKHRLYELYHGEGLSCEEIGERWDCHGSTVRKWMNRYGVPRRTPKKERDNGWRDKDTLYRMYWEERKTTTEIADELDTNPGTISKWLKRNGIPTRRDIPSIQHTGGYECFDIMVDGESRKIWHHRLLAIAMGELNPSDLFNQELDVHHKNEIPWDNRPENLEVMGHGEHRRHHALK